jgi:hypothetical protein
MLRGDTRTSTGIGAARAPIGRKNGARSWVVKCILLVGFRCRVKDLQSRSKVRGKMALEVAS